MRKHKPQPAYIPRRHHAAPYNYHYPAVPQNKTVVLGGTAYESNNRKLTRKAAPGAATASAALSSTVANAAVQPRLPPSTFSRPRPGYMPMVKPQRVHKPGHKMRFSKNKVLDNTGSGSGAARRPRKQCRHFSLTGVCARARTCPYEHDPNKVAICPRFLQRECPLDASTCPLSHDPTPERVPLCVHFANNGRCKNGSSCLYPHFKVGPREGVCRDFAVLGYCEKGIDCDKQHIRECPDFAESGRCANRQCKLPHVIRANRTRQVAPSSSSDSKASGALSGIPGAFVDTEPAAIVLTASGEEEFIPLTFHESSDDEDASDADDDGSDDSGGEPIVVDEP
ncbi:hypothetical protein AURDEDRAFT_113216 [Auricularia subglabra TFB-10046 SS5]|nr:hypothetical protein AURDEDRAFT_113216 [Auricularia subglabra TFB-10046 SS5]